MKQPRKKLAPPTEEEQRHDRWHHGRRVARDPARALCVEVVQSGWTARRARKRQNWLAKAPHMAVMAAHALDKRLRPHAPAVLRELGWQPNALQRRLGLQPPGCLLIDLAALYGWVKRMEAAASAGAAAADSEACAATRQRAAAAETRLRGLTRDGLMAALLPTISGGGEELKRLYHRATPAFLRARALEAYLAATAPRPASVAGPLTDFHAAPGGKLPLTQKNAKEVIQCRGSARYVSITDSAHALVHDLALFLATTLVVDDAPGGAAWRLSGAALTSWAATTIHGPLRDVFAALEREWLRARARMEALATAAAGAALLRDDAPAAGADAPPPPTAPATPEEAERQLVAFLLGAALEWFMSDLTLRAAFMQWPEENQCSVEIKPQDITSALAAGLAFPQREFVTRLSARAQVHMKERHANAAARRLAKLTKKAAEQRQAARKDADAAAAQQQQ
jgi:hypothetical protein